MISTLLTAFLSDGIRVARTAETDTHGFKKSELQILLGNDYPSSLSEYLASKDAGSYTDDLRDVLMFLRGAHSPRDSALLESFGRFLSEDLALSFDQLPDQFAFWKEEKRQEFLQKMFPSKTGLFQGIRSLLLVHDPGAILRAMHEWMSRLYGTAPVLVQTATSLSSDERRAIRQRLLRQYPRSIPVFTVERRIGGGFRLFAGGSAIDRSWESSVHTLLTSISRTLYAS